MVNKTRKTLKVSPFLLSVPLTAVMAFLAFYLAQTRPGSAQTVDMKTQALKWSGSGLKVELQSMPLDLVRAFFLGRGFSKKDADFIANSGCIFRSAIGNSGGKAQDPVVTIELAKWQISDQQRKQSLRTREDWATIWKGRSISENAKVAFHWALFPTRQTYQSSDYNWGMISFALPPGTKFNLEVHWMMGNQPQSTLFKGLECGK